jgi:hypothetical protein
MSNNASGKHAHIFEVLQKNLDQIQKIIYGTSENVLDAEISNPQSVHLYQFSRVAWYSKIPRIISGTGQGPERFYNLSGGKYDLLSYTTFRQQMPIIKVKPEFIDEIEICWVKDLAFNIFSNGVVSFSTDEVSKIDSKSIDIYYDVFNNNSDRSYIDKQIGNIPMLRTWNTLLPSTTVKFVIPWHYNKDQTLGLPLYYSSDGKDWSHTINLNNDISNLLRMRRYNTVTKTYDIIKTDMDCVYTEFKGEANLRSPEILGMFIKLLPDEVDNYKCWTMDNKYGDFYIEDVNWLKSDNSFKYGTKISQDIIEDGIVHSIVWMAENKNSTDITNPSNYSTNILNEYDNEGKYKDFDPIKSTSLTVGSYEYFKDLPADYTGNLFFSEFKGKPTSKHYHVWTFNRYSNSINANMGINMSLLKSRLAIDLVNSDPYLKTINDKGTVTEAKSDDNPEFVLNIYLFIQKKISFHSINGGKDKWGIMFKTDQFRENLDLLG